ncbi:hypothetical protein B1H19_31360 [Streptomyces gilvosporeus]|uniref:Uncharacterized protein n=1 Tax=Streptomyces gilvosporeus TaxID=553510 RepID=A0A1V0TZ63_9ACTN|nr:hypothetical protein B1H19_31360 [Streptomyces gilvosporeus]
MSRRTRSVELRAEQLLIANGRRPVTAGLNLDAVGVKTSRTSRGGPLCDAAKRIHSRWRAIAHGVQLHGQGGDRRTQAPGESRSGGDAGGGPAGVR